MVARVPKRRKISAKEAAAKRGVSVSTIMKQQAEPRAAYLARARSREDEAYAYFEAGVAVKDIASALNITYATAQGLVRRAKLRRGQSPSVKGPKPQKGAQRRTRKAKPKVQPENE